MVPSNIPSRSLHFTIISKFGESETCMDIGSFTGEFIVPYCDLFLKIGIDSYKVVLKYN